MEKWLQIGKTFPYRQQRTAPRHGTLTSEAVTNAVNACRRADCAVPLTVFAEYTGVLRVFVHDEAPGVPAARLATRDEEAGRGLAILTACATDWGVCRHGPAPGKAIWFELAAAAGE